MKQKDISWITAFLKAAFFLKTGSIIMKNLFLPFVVVALFAVGSCGDDTVQPSVSKDQDAVEILSFTPDSSLPRAQIVITGKNFSTDKDSNKVWFTPSALAYIDSATSTQLFVRVSDRAASGVIVVSNGRTSDTSEKVFNKLEHNGNFIKDFFPKTGERGTIITIVGKGFGWDTYDLYVTFDTASSNPKPIQVIDDTLIRVKVPNDAVTGQIGVYRWGHGYLWSKDIFTVTGEHVPEKQQVTSDLSIQIHLSGSNSDINGKVTPTTDILNYTQSKLTMIRSQDSLIYDYKLSGTGSNRGSHTIIIVDYLNKNIKQLQYSEYYSNDGISPGSPKSGSSSSFMLKNIPFSWQDSTIVVSLDSIQTKSLITAARKDGYNQGVGGSYRTSYLYDTVINSSGLNLNIKYK